MFYIYLLAFGVHSAGYLGCLSVSLAFPHCSPLTSLATSRPLRRAQRQWGVAEVCEEPESVGLNHTLQPSVSAQWSSHRALTVCQQCLGALPPATLTLFLTFVLFLFYFPMTRQVALFCSVTCYGPGGPIQWKV